MKSLFVIFAFVLSSLAFADFNPRTFRQEHNQKLKEDIENGKLKERALEATENALRFGAAELRKRGMDNEADRIMQDWIYNQKAFMLDYFSLKAITDHEPIQWLYDTWKLLDDALGTQFMVMSHLDDLFYWAYGFRTTFFCFDQPNLIQYMECYVPVIEGIVYWSAYISCEVACMASGAGAALSLICSPLAVVCEDVTTMFISPKLGPIVYKKVCEE